MADNERIPEREVHPDTPRHRSPFMVMALILATLIIVSIYKLGTSERVSIRASIVMPPLNAVETQGQMLFNEKCATCHGVNATGGTKTGNPLLHPYYRASLLSDEAFLRTIKRGAPQRLWKFGHMDPLFDIPESESRAMLAFFNALRMANSMDD